MIAARIQAPVIPARNPAALPHHGVLPAPATKRLRWVNAGLFRNQYELRSDDRCVETLRIQGFVRPSASCEGVNGSWSVEPMNADSGAIVVRNSHTFREVGSFVLGSTPRGGLLRTPGGDAYVLEADFWKGRAEFQTPSGKPLLRYRFCGLLHPTAEIELVGNADWLREIPWLVMFGWCVIVGYL